MGRRTKIKKVVKLFFDKEVLLTVEDEDGSSDEDSPTIDGKNLTSINEQE